MSDLPTFTPSTFPPSVFNYARPRHFIQSQSNFQAPSYESVQGQPQNQPQIQTWNQTQAKIQCQSVIKTHSQTQAFKETQSQSQAFKETQSHLNGSSKSTSLSSNLISTTSYQAPSDPLPTSSLSSSSCFPMPNPTFIPASSSSTMSTATVCSTITLIPRVPSATGLGSASLPSQPEISSPAAFLCSVLPSQASQSSQSLPKQSPDPPQMQSLSPADLLPPPPGPAELSLSNLNQHSGPKPPVVNLVSNAASSPHAFQPPSVVSFPDSYRKTPDILPKPIMRKPVTQCPSNRSTDEEIQGSKDALIQDLEKKLRCKEAHSRNSQQKLSYEERMARRLLGPDNASYVLDMENPDSHLDQPDPPEGRHSGGLWGKHHSGTKRIEGSAIQEKRYAPRFLQVPQDLTVEEGRFCRIDFKVCGLPTPDVSWYLDGKAIRPDDYHKMLVCENNVHSFIIEIVTVHHTGVYECVARNRAGETSFTMKLDVIAQEVLLPPTFVQKMLNSHALEGDTVRLECKVEASPPPKLFWKKDKDMLRIDPHRMSLYQDGSGRQCLLIERVMKTDAGWYTLSAINSAGLSTCNARLDIGIRPPIRKAIPGSKSLKLLSSFSQLPVETPKQHAAPLFESEEL